MNGPMSGFVKKYFGHFQYINQDRELEIQTVGRSSVRCAVPSVAPSPDKFLPWFSDYVSRELDGARGSWRITPPERESTDEGARLLLAIPSLPTADVPVRWDHVQVIGQFHRCRDASYQDGLLRLCRSAYRVFANQPTRLFLHAFYIRGSLIELWVFDRSGLYCSDVFHIQTDFIQFLSVILTYQRMTDRELGKSNIVETDEGGSYFTIPSLQKLYLDPQPIASSEELVGAGTTCYRARNPDSNKWNHVLKFKWRWARERPEDELLKLAGEKGVWGAVSLDYYRELETTANLRRNIRWGPHRRFAEGHDSSETKRRDADGLVDYTEGTNDFFRNRILTCMVTSPLGRALQTFQSIPELLQVFHDAIKCHRSLYLDAKILHQDISPGNIVILDQETPKAILIDLDSAIDLDLTSDEPEHGIIGTRPFMAIGVLRSEWHTYRHDLESFLYVFLWTMINNHAENPVRTSKLRRWSRGSWDELATRKTLDMHPDNFQAILREMSPEFDSLKPLAESLRRILFPLRGESLWTGTDNEPEAVDALYDDIICAFEGAIASEGRR